MSIVLVHLCMIHRGRTLPLVWRVTKHNSANASFRDYQDMIQNSIAILSKGVKVVLLASGGLAHTEFMAMLT